MTLRAGDARYALTATCAANALGLVPAGSYAAGSREAALAGVRGAGRASALRPGRHRAGRARRRRHEDRRGRHAGGARLRPAARRTASSRSAAPAPRSVPRSHGGWAGRCCVPDHPEVLSSIGAALSLVRAEAVRTSTAAGTALRVARDAELACIAAGAAAATISVETTFDPRTGEQRAVATGAVALQAGASSALQCGDDELADAAAEALNVDAGVVAAGGRDRLLPHLRGPRGRRRVGRRPARRHLVRRADAARSSPTTPAP